MGHTYSQIYLHIVWGTKKRNPIIHDSEIVAIGNTYDHIHVLVKISPKTLISKMVLEFKGSTSYFINHNSENTFYWQNGYGILSISLPAIDTVKKYVEDQKIKHELNETVKSLEIASESN